VTTNISAESVNALVRTIDEARFQKTTVQDLQLTPEDIARFKKFIDQQEKRIKKSGTDRFDFDNLYHFPGENTDFSFYKNVADSVLLLSEATVGLLGDVIDRGVPVRVHQEEDLGTSGGALHDCSGETFVGLEVTREFLDVTPTVVLALDLGPPKGQPGASILGVVPNGFLDDDTLDLLVDVPGLAYKANPGEEADRLLYRVVNGFSFGPILNQLAVFLREGCGGYLFLEDDLKGVSSDVSETHVLTQVVDPHPTLLGLMDEDVSRDDQVLDGLEGIRADVRGFDLGLNDSLTLGYGFVQFGLEAFIRLGCLFKSNVIEAPTEGRGVRGEQSHQELGGEVVYTATTEGLEWLVEIVGTSVVLRGNQTGDGEL